MKNNKTKKRGWPRVVSCGSTKVKVYRRITPNGAIGFMVAYRENGKRVFKSYSDETVATVQAEALVNRLSTHGVEVATVAPERISEYLTETAKLPVGISLSDAVSTLLQALRIVGDIPAILAACQFYKARHKQTTAKPVADVVTDLLAVKKARQASERYLSDLRTRLEKFSGCSQFKTDIHNVTTAGIQAWLDGLKLSTQSTMNYRRVLHLLFEFAIARGYCQDNPIAKVEKVKIRNGETHIFKPSELARLLAAASPDFQPCIAIGAFAGLRSAEIERLEWSDIDLAGRNIVVGASKAKTASRRVIPINDTLAEWLTPYAAKTGKVWKGEHDAFYDAQQDTATATVVEADAEQGIRGEAALKWKSNALRHSYASYRFAQCGDAGRVAGELGNSAGVVHKHYRELVKPADAVKWFAVKPESPENVLSFNKAVAVDN